MMERERERERARKRERQVNHNLAEFLPLFLSISFPSLSHLVVGH